MVDNVVLEASDVSQKASIEWLVLVVDKGYY